MKLKSYQLFLESNQDIDSICSKYGIENYTINGDGSIDVDGDVDLVNRNISELPLKFRNVTGDFYCYRNKLTEYDVIDNYGNVIEDRLDEVKYKLGILK